MANDFVSVFKKIEKSIAKTKRQALRAALAETRTLYAKRVKEATGLPSGKIKKRSKYFVNNSGASGVLSIGTRVLFKASDLAPLVKKVKSRLGFRYGATVKFVKLGRTLLEKAFIIVGKNSGKKIVMARTGADREPIKEVAVEIFEEAVKGVKPELEENLAKSFKKNFDSKLKYNLTKE